MAHERESSTLLKGVAFASRSEFQYTTPLEWEGGGGGGGGGGAFLQLETRKRVQTNDPKP